MHSPGLKTAFNTARPVGAIQPGVTCRLTDVGAEVGGYLSELERM
ncbi:MAG: hypothetical protein U0401_00230 [Anaerolineae bacterium]